MNLLNMFNLMAIESADELCGNLTPVWTIFGYVIFAIKIIVPLLLIVTGMLSLAQAVMKQKEDDIKKAQSLLVTKLIFAVLTYLVITITGVVVGLVTKEDWKGCAQCAFNPWSKATVDGKEVDACYITGGNEITVKPES